MRSFLIGLLVLVSVEARSAVLYYDSYPNNPNPPTTFIISLQTTDKSAGGTPYNYWTLAQMSNWIQASFSVASSNYVNQVSNSLYQLFTSGFTTTNLIIAVGGQLKVSSLTPSALVSSDGSGFLGSVANGSGVATNDGSGGVTWVLPSVFLGPYVLNVNGNSTNQTNWGVSQYAELDANKSYLTNTFFLTNIPPATPDVYGENYYWNSNGTYFVVASKVNSLFWTKTNFVSAP